MDVDHPVRTAWSPRQRAALDSGDSVMAEAGAMVSMSPGLEIQTSASRRGRALEGSEAPCARR